MLFTKKQDKPHVPSKVKAFGRARLEIAQRAQNREAWENLWKPPMQEFPFEWGPHWKQCVEYKVDDFSAEVGFLIDVLGLPVNAFNPDYAMFTSPGRDFFFAVVQVSEGVKSTPSDSLRIQFMVADIFALAEKLKGRGVLFEDEPGPVAEGSEQWVATFRTPHGIHMEIWGLVEMVPDFGENPVQERMADSAMGAVQRDTFQPVELPSTGGLPVEKPILEKIVVETPAFPVPANKPLIEEIQPIELEGVDQPDLPAPDSDPIETPDSEYRYTSSARATDSYPSHAKESKRPQSKIAEPQTEYTVRKMESAPDEAETVQALPRQAKPPSRNGKKKVRLLPRSAVRAAIPSAVTSQSMPEAGDQVGETSFKPAPKKSEPGKPSSIWDDFAEDVEYLDMDEPTEEGEYHYKPIPLNRDE